MSVRKKVMEIVLLPETASEISTVPAAVSSKYIGWGWGNK
jgi:hypothetical protein